MRSTSQEDYLKAIYQLSNDKDGNVSTNAIAAYLNVKASSCTDMVKKLSSDGLVTHEPYRGVRLTESGRKDAVYLVRKHRLWETFLFKTLDFNWGEVHEIAEQLEHTVSPELIRRLDSFLGHPKLDPHGDPIPDENGIVQKIDVRNLESLKPPASLTIVGVRDHSSEFYQALTNRRIFLGSPITLVKVFDYDQSSVVVVDGREQTLSLSITKNLLVSISSQDE